jgi:alpha-tubulin suppressor-like RCC1 family protein
VDGGYDLIFVTTGGNDLNFRDVVKFCLVGFFRDGANCGPLLDQAESALDGGGLKQNIKKALKKIGDQANPRARIVLLGYPYLEGDPKYRLRSGHFGNTSIEVGKRLRKIGDKGDKLQEKVVHELNNEDDPGRFVFVNVKSLFAGHELFADSNNPDRWFIQPSLDADIFETSLWYHPNPTGWHEEAQLLLDDPRIPKLDLNGGEAAPALGPAGRVTAGGDHSCALHGGGQVACWGDNAYGALGDGSTMGHTVPVIVQGLTDATAVAAGEHHTCALRSTGQVACWGPNFGGEVGDGSSGTAHLVPYTVPGLDDATAISANRGSTCALRSTGQVACWGYLWGGLGDGTSSVYSYTPRLIDGLVDATAISAGVEHSCALRRTGQVACWGGNLAGELGDATPTHSSDTPVTVRGLTDATGVAAGNFFSCAVRVSGGVACWGMNEFGGLGDGTGQNSDRSVSVLGLNDATELVSSMQHTCARRVTNEAVCWGSNLWGGLGDGTFENRWAPVAVQGLTDAQGLAVGNFHSCALRVSGQVVCWGYNSAGQVGDGTKVNRPTPVPVAGFS